MAELNIKFGQIPFWAICNFGMRSKIEIIAFSYICARRFRQNETADCPRSEIIEKTGLDKSQLSVALRKLIKDKWLEPKSKTKWFIPEIEPEKVEESTTKVDDSTTEVEESTTKVEESSTPYNKDSYSSHSSHTFTQDNSLDGREQAFWQAVMDGLKERLQTPVMLPDEFEWKQSVEWAFVNHFEASQCLEVYDLLEKIRKKKKQKWRVTASIWQNNIPRIETLRSELEDLENGISQNGNHRNGKGEQTTKPDNPRTDEETLAWLGISP